VTNVAGNRLKCIQTYGRVSFESDIVDLQHIFT
jgi:hypothetical protein